MIASISFGVRVRYLPPYGLPKRSHASHARAPQNISAVGSTDTTAEAGLWFQCREGVAVITSRRTSVFAFAFVRFVATVFIGWTDTKATILNALHTTCSFAVIRRANYPPA